MCVCVSVCIVRSGTVLINLFIQIVLTFYANTSKFQVSASYDGAVEGAVNRSRNFLDFLIAKVRV